MFELMKIINKEIQSRRFSVDSPVFSCLSKGPKSQELLLLLLLLLSPISHVQLCATP